MGYKRIKTGKNKGKYLDESGMIITQKQLKQMKSGYDINIKSKCKDPTVKMR